MSKYEELSTYIIKKVGGKENILGVTHCVTRLRFSLKEMELVDEKALRSKKGIATAQASGGQYQVVIGTHVGDVFEEVIQKLDGQQLQDEKRKEGVINSIISIITKAITPLLGGLMGCGMIQGLLSILTVLGITPEGSGSYLVLNAMGQALFTFMPLLVAYSTAKVFKLDPAIGMIIAAVLIFPGLAESMTQGDVVMNLFKGSFLSMEVFQTFFGIPVVFPAFGYNSAIIPTIIIIYFASRIEHALKRVVPQVIQFTLVPFFTILITVPLALLIIGPIFSVLMNIIGWVISSLYGFSTVLASVIVALVYQPLVILGLHWPLFTFEFQNLGTLGYDAVINPTYFAASFAQLAVVAAVFFRTKSKNVKEICIPAMISALFCIIEPAIYGVTLPVKKRFVFSMIGGAVGAAIMCTFGAVAFAPMVGIFGFSNFINPNGDMTGIIVAVIGVIMAMLVSFLLTFFTFRENEKDETIENHDSENINESNITAPIEGRVAELKMAEDSAFANGLLGKGILIYPSVGKLVAPCDGKVTTVFPTKHAIGITNTDGVEILIHVGKDTVHLKGEYFTTLIKQDDFVRRGDELVNFDIEAIKKAGFSLETPLIITNSDDYSEIRFTEKDYVETTDELLAVQLNSAEQNRLPELNELGVE